MLNGMHGIAAGVAMLSTVLSVTAELPMEQMVSVDFSQAKGKVRRELHSSGLAPLMSPRAAYADFDPALRELNLYAARTHDWALTNPGQRIIDTHFVFPLQHLDAANPSNYYFKATDEAIRLAQEAGLKVFYRLGSSIELTEGRHFNVLAPTDFDYAILGRGRRLNKVYYGLKAYGAMMIEGAETCPTRVKAGYETVTPFAVRTADGKKAMLLLTDYRSSSAVREFSAEVKGVEKFRRVSARVLDDTRDLEPCAVSFEDGVLTWRKADFKSCALLVTWEM